MVKMVAKGLVRMLVIGKQYKSGFTLIEIVVALILVGLAVTMIMPDLSKMQQKHQVRLIQDQLTEDLLMVRNEAIVNDRTIKIEFLPDARIYQFKLGTETTEQSFTPFIIKKFGKDKEKEEEAATSEEEGEKTEKKEDSLTVSFFSDGTSSGLYLVFADEYYQEEYICQVNSENSQITWNR